VFSAELIAAIQESRRRGMTLKQITEHYEIGFRSACRYCKGIKPTKRANHLAIRTQKTKAVIERAMAAVDKHWRDQIEDVINACAADILETRNMATSVRAMLADGLDALKTADPETLTRMIGMLTQIAESNSRTVERLAKFAPRGGSDQPLDELTDNELTEIAKGIRE
jgi:hypothetical protein